MKNRQALSQREKLFCVNYLKNADAKQAAISAGYANNPDTKGEQLLSRSDIVEEISSLAKQRDKLNSAMSRILCQKLAFGSIADAISLLYLDSPDKSQLEKMDLCMISEIKKPKDGAMEIKFFDRLKAIEKLSQIQSEQTGKANSFLDALYLGAEKLSDIKEDEDGV